MNGFLLLLCFVQVLKKIGRYIQDQNNNVYIPRGVLLIDPVERGLRVVSFLFLYFIFLLLSLKVFCILGYLSEVINKSN